MFDANLNTYIYIHKTNLKFTLKQKKNDRKKCRQSVYVFLSCKSIYFIYFTMLISKFSKQKQLIDF